MIISRTPFRISFFGGGTDYPQWYHQETGAVLSTTIDKYIYISCRYLPPFFPQRHRIIWSRNENTWSIDEIQHPAIRETLKYLGFNDSEGMGVDLHYQGDLPARSGMGSSSAFTVGILNALSALRCEHISRHDLAQKAMHVEQNLLKESVGAQDQIAAAYGGLNHIQFARSGAIAVEPVVLKPERLAELEGSLMLFFSGLSRTSSDIASEFIGKLNSNRDSLLRMHRMVDQGIGILTGSASLTKFGTLLDESWQLKRNLSARVSNDTINTIYETARDAGAIGGKLLGAGESGFMLFYVPPERRLRVRAALKNYLHVPFRFSWQGSNIIYYDKEFTDGWIDDAPQTAESLRVSDVSFA